MEISIHTLPITAAVLMFIIGWVLAVADKSWRSPILWVTSAIAVALFIR